MKKQLNFDYGAIHAFYWMLYGVTSSFASAFLLAAGYTNGEIGIILAVGNVTAVFLQPLIADLADRSSKVSLLGVIKLCTVLLLLLEAGLFVYQHRSAALWVLFAMLTAWMMTLHPLLNSLSFKLEEAGVHINFGVCRSMGSLSYAILCAVLGTLVENHGAGVLPVAGVFSFAALLLTLFLVGKHFQEACAKRAGEPQSAVQNTEVQQNERINLLDFLRGNKVFAWMQLGVAAVYFHNSILNNYMLQIVEGVGGNSEDMGRIFSVMAFLEIPALFFFDKIHKRFSCQVMLKVASVCFVLKILLVYLAQDIVLIYAAHFLQPLSLALFLPAMVAFINEIMRKGEAVKGQALYTMMITISSIISSVAGGFLLDTAGAKFMLLTATTVTAVGAAAVILLIGRIGKRSEDTSEDAGETGDRDQKNCA